MDVIYVASRQEVPAGETVAIIRQCAEGFVFVLQRGQLDFRGPPSPSKAKALARSGLCDYARRLGITRLYRVLPWVASDGTSAQHH